MSMPRKRTLLMALVVALAGAAVWVLSTCVPASVYTVPIEVIAEPDASVAENQTVFTADVEFAGPEAYTEVMRFNQDDIALNMFCRKSASTLELSEAFTVELHRVRWGIFDELVGSVELERNGDNSALWRGAGSGDYYFKLIKDDDHQVVSAGHTLFYSLSYS